MNIFDAFPSKYIKAADLKGREIELAIREVTLEDVGDGKIKPIVYFERAQKGLLLNRVNSTTIADAYSPETNRWTGRPIVLFPTKCEYRGASVDCIRIKIPQIIPTADQTALQTASDEQEPFSQPHEFATAGNGQKASVIQL